MTQTVNRIIGMEKELKAIRAGVENNLPVLMVGETGVGKTYAILEVAKEMNKSIVRISLNGEVGITELLGKYTLNKGDMKWQDGVLVSAMRNGEWVVLDEMNAALPEVLFCLNSLMDDSHSVVLSEKDGERIVPHEDFRIFATINPCDNYVGTKEINPALLSRFPIILWVNYPEPEQELKIIQLHVPELEEVSGRIIVDVVNELRKIRREGKINLIVGVRDAVNWAKIILKCNLSLEDSLEWAIINKAKKEEWKIIGDAAKKATDLKINWHENARGVGKKLTNQVLESLAKLESRNEKLKKALRELENEISFTPATKETEIPVPAKPKEKPKKATAELVEPAIYPVHLATSGAGAWLAPTASELIAVATGFPHGEKMVAAKEEIVVSVGDFVKLSDYGACKDWFSHKGQVACVVSITGQTASGHSASYPIVIKWSDGTESATPPENLIFVKKAG